MLSKNSSRHIVTQRLPGLDLLRTIAILLVFMWHYCITSTDAAFSTLGQFGWAGVDLFYVLSGYLIGNQLFKDLAAGKKISLKKFYLRRALRTLPNYIFILVLYFTLPGFREYPTLAPLWKFVTFTLNFDLSARTGASFAHAWSLCVEEQFYLILPLIVLCCAWKGKARKVVILTGGVFILGLFLRTQIWHQFLQPFYGDSDLRNLRSAYFHYLYYPTYNRLDPLWMGVVLAALKNFRPNLWIQILKHSNKILLLGFAGLIGAGFLCMDKYNWFASVWIFPLLGLSFSCLLIAALNPTAWLAKVRIPGVSWLALTSYSHYLTHKQAIYFSSQFFPELGLDAYDPIGFFLVLILSVVFASILYLMVERPFLNLRNKLLS